MTKPVSRLEWFPDPVTTLAVRAGWFGAGWHYTLFWGDGSSQRVLHTQPPVRHRYPAADTYTLTAVSEITQVQVSTRITVRPQRTPQVSADHLGGGRVRLTIVGGWRGDVLHRVDWGDGIPAQEYSGTQLTPEHQYPAGIENPTVLVQDVPARRAVTLVVPIDPSEPPPTDARFGWHVTRLWDDRPGSPGNIERADGVVLGAGVPAGAVVGLSYIGGSDVYATADRHGHVTFPQITWIAGSRQFMPPFRSARIWYPDRLHWPTVQLPCLVRRDEVQDVVPVYTIDPGGDPMVLTIGVANPQAGTYRVLWGDGTAQQDVVCDGRALRASHRYRSGARVIITVTDPDGNSGERVVAAPEIGGPWWGPDALGKPRLKVGVRDLAGGDWFTPLSVDWGWDGQSARFWGHPTAPDGKQNALEEWYPNDLRGQDVTVCVSAPLRPALIVTRRIPPAGSRNHVQPDPPGSTGKSINKGESVSQTHPPTLAAEGYVTPGGSAGIQLQHLWTWVQDVRFKSAAFVGGLSSTYTATLTDHDILGRVARAEVQLAEVDPGEYEVVAVANDGAFEMKHRLIVEAVHAGTIIATLTPLDDQGKVDLRVEPISRNAAWADASTPANQGDGEDWFGLVFQRPSDTAHATLIIAGVKPGTYPIAVRQRFHGGKTIVVNGTVTVPADPTKPAKGELPLVYTHPVDTNKLGNGSSVEHVIDFGDEHDQANARYGVAVELVVTGPNGQKPDLPADVRAALRDLRPLTVARATDHVTLYGGNPDVLRGNKNFKIKLVVTITPVPTPAGYSEDDDPTAPDHAAELATSTA